MKTLILVRHAKSDWPEDTADFDRPLAEKGVADARKMAAFLTEKNIEINRFISSPALRALSTCELFAADFPVPLDTDPKLYHPSEENFESVISRLDEADRSVALFSHNNGISNFANSISEEIFSFPTCGVAGFEANCDSWAEFLSSDIKRMFFFEPKKI